MSSDDPADLYGGLVIPAKKAKRDAPLEADKLSKQHEETVVPTTKRMRTEKPPLDLPATIAKLIGYMRNDKKFAKASVLFGQLIDNQLTTETSALFLEALKDAIAAKGITTWTGKKEFAALIEKVDNKRAVLSPNELAMVDDWKLLAITHAQLFTDDTYEFVKAAKVVKIRLESLVVAMEATSANDGNEEQSVRASSRELLMPLLRTLYSKHHIPWAKTMVETVLAIATRHRLRFTEEQREEIDTWTKTIRDRRSAPSVTRSAGSEARRNVVVQEDGTNASETTVKVGRANHPLFNKEI